MMAAKKVWTELVTVVPDAGPPNPEPALRELRQLLLADPPDEEAVADYLVKEFSVGRPVARLLLGLVALKRQLEPVAAEAEPSNQAVIGAEFRRNELQRFRPSTADDIIRHSALLRETEQAWVKALTRRGEAERAGRWLAWVMQWTYWIWNMPKPVKVLGDCPFLWEDQKDTEPAKLFEQLRCDADNPDSWLQAPTVATPRPKARLVTLDRRN